MQPSDVKASIERLFLAGSPGRGLFRDIQGAAEFERTHSGGISGIVARDDADQIEFRLTGPDPAFLRVLALPFAFVVPQGTPPADQSTADLSTAGPYHITDYAPGAHIELEPNPGYVPGAAGPATPGPDRIDVRLGLDAAAAVRGVAAGTIDYVQPRPGSEEIAAAQAAGSRARIHRWVEGTTYYFFMNTRRAPFNDVRVRRAVNLAIDRSALAAEFRGAAVPSSQVLPPGVPGRRDVEASPAPDIPRARALVRAAGATGAPVVVWGHTTEPSPAVTERLAATLRAIGLRATTRLWDRSEMLTALADPAAPSQIGYARWRQDYPDGADWYPLLLSRAGIRTGGNLNYCADRRHRPRPPHRPRRPDLGRRAPRDPLVGRQPGGGPPRALGPVRQQRAGQHHLLAGARLRGPPALRVPLDAGAARVTTGMLRKGSSTMEGEAWPRWTGTRGTAR